MAPRHTIDDLRAHLFETLKAMEPVQHTHTVLTRERAVYVARLQRLDAALAALAPLLPGEIPAEERPPSPTAPAAAPPARVGGAVHGFADQELLDAIATHQPIAPKVLAGLFAVTSETVRARLRALEQQGLVRCTGTTTRRRVWLASHAPATAPPPADVPPPAPATLPVDSPEAVQRRDAAILARLARGRATLDDLVAALPDDVDAATRQTLCRRALRRLSVRGQVVDVGLHFQLVAGGRA